MAEPTIEDLLPDINSYLESTNSKYAITIEGLEELVNKVRSKTGLTSEAAKTVIRLIFHEMRNSMLQGNTIKVFPIGNLYINISKPRLSKGKKSYNRYVSPIISNYLKFTQKIRKYDGTS